MVLNSARQTALAVILLASALGTGSPALGQASGLAVRFSPGAGTFVGTQTVTLSAPEGAAIRYTLDGSQPTFASPLYQGPLTLDTSTRLRAVAIAAAPGGAIAGPGQPGPVATEVFLRVDKDAATFTSHLPIILIHTFESGRLDAYGTEHNPAVILVLEPHSGTSHLVGSAALDSRIGVRVRGESSRRFPKKQYAVELREDGQDTDSDRPLLGMPANSDWVLSDPLTYDRSLIRNALAFSLSNRIGRYAPRTRFAEVFMVDDGGDVRAGSFLGLFTLIEKISRGAERVDVERLPASAASAPAITGGYILRIDKGVADFAAAGRRVQFVYPDSDDMLLPERAPQVDFISTFIEDFALAARAPDFKHPRTGQHYSAFIDVDGWIDHHILNTLAKNVDALRFSAYFYKERGGRLSAGPLWDFDRSFGTLQDPRAGEPEEWKQMWSDGTDPFNEGWWGLLFRDPDFRSRYRKRFTSLLDGELSPDNVARTIDGMVAEIGDAAPRNFRRWPETPPQDDSYAVEIGLMKDFLRRRTAWLKTQLSTGF
jgi:hypothetical protein